MKATLLVLAAAGAVLVGGCATHRNAGPAIESRIQSGNAREVGYDDHLIAQIHRGETTENQLLKWFGPPVSRDVKPDGRAHLAWSFGERDDGESAAGRLSVSLAPNGKVEAYSARQEPALKRRTVEFAEKSDTDIREHMAEWAREGWKVLSLSARLPQEDGTVHRKAVLSRAENGGVRRLGYSDSEIAKIQRGQTTEAQLVEWFGSPESREVRSDGRAQLAWSFVGRTDNGPGGSGMLSVSLASDGQVSSYSARRSPE